MDEFPILGKILGVIAVLFGVYILLALVFSFWPFSVAAGVVKQVTEPTHIISSYEYFYDMYGQIKATYQKYIIARDAGLSEATGIKMVLSSMIEEYNSKSREITHNLWKADDLPYEIEMKDLE